MGDPNYARGTWHQAIGVTASVDILFNATNITVLADSWYNHNRFYCYLVDMPDEPWAWFNQSVGSGETSVVFNQTLCSVTGITNSSHTLRMGMYAQDASVLDLDWYIFDKNTLPGSKPVWTSGFPSVDPPENFAETTSLTTTTSSSLSTSRSSTSASTSRTSASSSQTTSAGSSSSSSSPTFPITDPRSSSSATQTSQSAGLSTSLTSYVATPAPPVGTTTSSAALNIASPPSNDSGSATNSAAIGAGAGIGAVLLLGGVAALIYWLWGRRKKRTNMSLRSTQSDINMKLTSKDAQESDSDDGDETTLRFSTPPGSDDERPPSTVMRSTISYDLRKTTYNPTSPAPYGALPSAARLSTFTLGDYPPTSYPIPTRTYSSPTYPTYTPMSPDLPGRPLDSPNLFAPRL